MSTPQTNTAEDRRLRENASRLANWQRWGPYLSERQWGTVREDYSADGDSWRSFPHDHSRSRAYRWGEDGLLGICDRQCRLCFSLALWNGRDPILKERLFGLTGPEGNHGEDVKECYYYLDSTPTHSFMRALYKYPQSPFPYLGLIRGASERGLDDPEYELLDTGVFDENRYFDVFAEYAKAGPEDLLIRIRVVNRGPESAPLHILPTLWYRNTWIWGCRHEGCEVRTPLHLKGAHQIGGLHPTLGGYQFAIDPDSFGNDPNWLFTENESNFKRLFRSANLAKYVKDAFHEYVISGTTDAVNPKRIGSKAAIVWAGTLEPGQELILQARLFADESQPSELFGKSFASIFDQREQEADEFYATRVPSDPEKAKAARQAYAGLMWSKQFYHYIVADWLQGDPEMPDPPPERKLGRNHDWPHLFNRDIISMPDKWEYPWYAAWDLAFHMVPLAEIDPEFAKAQLLLMLREWYMHPNGQIPAYEFAFGDVNPPVHAWACWRVYKISGPQGGRDVAFLARAFQKLMLNFTWWVNRKDRDGKHLFAGGFLGLDNIGVFDRSKPLPGGAFLEQADGTAWMAFFCGTMLSMALELARFDPVYEDMASKFFEHFIDIVDAINSLGGTGLWDDEDGFYYDRLHQGPLTIPLKTRSLVGLIPLIAVEVLDDAVLCKLKGFSKRMDWFMENRRDLAHYISYMEQDEDKSREHGKRLLAVPSRERLRRMLTYMLDEQEFLSPYGVRSLSRVHAEHPYTLRLDGEVHTVRYTPAESDSWMFGGNSNWRGPVWFPTNYLLIEALERYYHFYGDNFTIEYPTGSGNERTLHEVAVELARRLSALFLPDETGRRPCHGDDSLYRDDPHWRDLILFYEYFHGDNGRGVGANHQTGWTALVARLLAE